MRRATSTALTAVTGLALVALTGCGTPDPAATSSPGSGASTTPSGRLSAPTTPTAPGLPATGTPAPPTATPTPTVARPDVLAALQRRGGMCPDGPCGTSLVVTTDGTWVRTGVESAQDGSGELTREQLEAVRDAVDATRLGSAPKFEGTCPTAADGQEIVLSWRTAGDLHTAASCTVRFPPADPLLRTLQRTLEELPDQAD